ncbi:MAG: hypothetical protein DRJ05_17840 [Bacteroidetes bacterium]|nr:MAG: hypothetical protein DRJ05_17840 [Bacteroidota bacterium]
MSGKSKHEIIENAVAGGVIGAALGAVITGKSEYTHASAIVGAAIGASLKAQKEANDLKVPVLYEEDGIIYKYFPNGERELVKEIEPIQKSIIPPTFTLG